LREAVERHLLVPLDDAADERFAFRHSLVQEAIQGELLPGHRARLHGLLAAAMATSGTELDASAAAELAYHWYAAHDLPRALEASLVAAELAQDMHAHGDAYTQYARALELWDRVPASGRRAGTDRIGLLERAANAAEVLTPGTAVDLIQEAIQLATGNVDDLRLASLKVAYGRYAWTSGDGVSALEACREAVELAPSEPPSLIRARALASLGQILMIVLEPEAKQVCEDAVAAARAVHSVQIEAHALNSLGTSNAYFGDVDLALQQLDESLDLARSIGSVDDVARAQNNRVDVLSTSGRFEAAGRAAMDSFADAEAYGLAHLFGVMSLAEASMAFYRAGSWAAAANAIHHAGRYQVSGAPAILIGGRAALLAVGQGRFDEAARRLDALGPLLERAVEGQLIAPPAEAAAELALWQGRPADARAAAVTVLDRLPAVPWYVSRTGPVFAHAIRAEADLSSLARARSDEAGLAESRARAADQLEQLRAIDEAARAGRPNFASQATAWRALGEAEMRRGDGRSDPASWTAAGAAFEQSAMPYPRAYALFRLADAILAGRGSRGAAAAALREGYSIAVALGSGALRAELEALAGRARIELAEHESVATPSSTRQRDQELLTPREREIIALVAAGRTNRQIAETLFITEKTAGHHVSNILAKLGVQGRTEAAAVAQRLGLLQDS
jgi:DNA-binding CsgD family transcriptional regulator